MTRSLLLIEDQTLVRESLMALINSTGRYQVVAAVGSVAEALEQLPQLPALDLILSDFHLRQDTAHSLFQQRPASGLPPVILLSSLFNAIEIQACMRLGARGFLFKECDLAEMLKAFDDVLAGGVYFSLRDNLPPSPPEQAPSELQLTTTQREILKWLATGMSNKQIAQALGKSSETVKIQVSQIMRRLNVRTRTQAVVKAASLNLL